MYGGDVMSALVGGIMSFVKGTLIQECKARLIEVKAELLNRMRDNLNEYQSRDRGGDETDLAVDMLAESQFVNGQDRLRRQLYEIEVALAKIEMGKFGICEETLEPIEENRLLAIPWTRLSVEGAEIREQMTKKYAK
jgi:DnaK suppressor protein